MHQTHRYMDAVPTDAISDLIRGWDTALDDEVLSRLGLKYDDLRAAVRYRVQAELTRPVVDA